MSWKIGLSWKVYLIGEGLKIVGALRTTPINGCEMDMRWFLN